MPIMQVEDNPVTHNVETFKKIIILFCVGAFILLSAAIIFVACTKDDTPSKPDPYAHITADSVTSNCTSPEEMHPISSIGYPMDALVVRHKDCLGVKDMFFVIWPGENTESKRTGAKLLMLLYLDYQNASNSKEKLSSNLIKVDQVEGGGSNESHMMIYSLTTKKLTEKKKETSKEVKL